MALFLLLQLFCWALESPPCARFRTSPSRAESRGRSVNIWSARLPPLARVPCVAEAAGKQTAEQMVNTREAAGNHEEPSSALNFKCVDFCTCTAQFTACTAVFGEGPAARSGVIKSQWLVWSSVMRNPHFQLPIAVRRDVELDLKAAALACGLVAAQRGCMLAKQERAEVGTKPPLDGTRNFKETQQSTKVSLA